MPGRSPITTGLMLAWVVTSISHQRVCGQEPCSNSMAVVGLEGEFCVEDWPICIPFFKDGACPGPQPGLELGSYCDTKAVGGAACRANTTGSGSEDEASQTPIPSPLEPPQTPEPTPGCGLGTSPVSIEGVYRVVCALEPVCDGGSPDGNCPGAQPGLEWGSYCGIVRTGIYGCRPYNGSDTESTMQYPSVRDCRGDVAGDTVVSVLGAGVYCANEPVCAGGQMGNCPRTQNGLAQSSACEFLPTGVYGCVAS